MLGRSPLVVIVMMIVVNVIIMIIAIDIMIIILIEQDATFTFINVAPQWQSFNAGDIYIIEIIDSQYQTLQTCGHVSIHDAGMN